MTTIKATAPPVSTPENTPVPGGGSWRWDATLLGWAPNTPDQPLHPAEPSAMQATEPNQE